MGDERRRDVEIEMKYLNGSCANPGLWLRNENRCLRQALRAAIFLCGYAFKRIIATFL
jgi:hypothetical protein